MLDPPTHDSFALLLNSQFQLERSSESIDMELLEVSELRASRGHESFSLVFRGPGDMFLPQETYRLNHSALGAIDLFIVPIGQDKQEVYRQFLSMSAGKTVLLISHRLGAARLADRIVVLHQGRIAQAGTHQELLRAGGPYAEMYALQAAWYQ